MKIAEFQHLYNNDYTLQIGTDGRNGQHKVILTERKRGNRETIRTFTNSRIEEALDQFGRWQIIYMM